MQQWMIWKRVKKTNSWGVTYEPVPGEIFNTLREASTRKTELIRKKLVTKKYTALYHKRSSFVISKVNVLCSQCQQFFPNGILDEFYGTCIDCTTEIQNAKQQYQLI